MDQLLLLTIIAEEELTASLEKELIALGAKGYTASVASGKGLFRVRDNPWEGENVKIETIVSEESCDLILQHLQHKYFERHAIIAFSHPVRVMRTSHFT